MTRILILVEGQVEEAFVKQVLNPRYDAKGLFFHPTVIETKRVLAGGSFRGGVTSFEKFKRHLLRLLGSARGDSLVTTMLDYYRLPDDFPGVKTKPASNAYDRVHHVEAEILSHFDGHRNFVPYLSLHEFEALLFSRHEAVPTVLNSPQLAAQLEAIIREAGAPELINERPGRSPAQRLTSLFPRYQKLLHGMLAARRIGLDAMRGACPHFDEWLSKIESVSRQQA